MGERIAQWLFPLLISRVAGQRPPNFVVGEDNPDGAYLLRWYLTPWRAWWPGNDADLKPWQRRAKAVLRRCLPNLYLHKFMRDDDDRALHDHPSWAISFILWGGYVEHTIEAGGIHVRREYRPGSLRFMRTRHTHRIELLRYPVDNGNPIVSVDDPAQPCWTLFLFGPQRRDWGFHCPERGWVPWQQFTAAGKPGEVGKGCEA